MNETPQFKHDCDPCRFLGRFAFDARYGEVTERVNVDLYVCREQDEDYATFLARRDDLPSRYTSCDKGTLERSGLLATGRVGGTFTPGVVEAYRRYKEGKTP